MITSTANQQVKQLIQLNKKGKLRNAQDIFVAEGPRMFREAPGERIEKIYLSETYFKSQWKEKEAEAPWEVVRDSVFKAMCDTQTPQGILCLVKQYHYSLSDLLKKENPLLLVLENIQDPGNLGTMMRTAEGAGADGVILSPGCADMYNPKTIRSTMGSVYRVPFFQTGNLKETMGQLREWGVNTFAAYLDGAEGYDRPDYRKGTAFLLGNEGNGLTQEAALSADTCIRIPMEGKLESLNVSAASAVLLYEAHRQRNL
ncbi:MAG: RNA methyltransferase [Lachnospiraceae bacterium]|nr:RNA methyltransferase [Lachnospiraceae bacterium]